MTEVSIATAAKLLAEYIKAGDSVMLWGPPGVGKSEVTYQESEADGRTVIDFRANTREPVDLRGIPVPDLGAGTTRWLVPDELPRVERDGERGTLFLDELNTASPQMQAALFQLILERRIGNYTLPEGWAIVCAGNRVKDRAAAQRMPTALRNRLAHIDVCVDVEAWTHWALANNVAPEIIAFVRFRRELLHMMPAGDENSFPTPRSITKCAKYVNAHKSVRQQLFAGLIGDGPAAELEGFVSLFRSLGDLDDIITNPTTAKLPTEPSERYAVTTGIARMATRKTLPNIITYAKRLPREYEVLAVTDAVRRDKSLCNVSAYGAWSIANQDIIIG